MGGSGQLGEGAAAQEPTGHVQALPFQCSMTATGPPPPEAVPTAQALPGDAAVTPVS